MSGPKDPTPSSDSGEIEPGDSPTDPSQLRSDTSQSERLKALDALGSFESRLNEIEREKQAREDAESDEA
jgi:hypothetical protein